MRYVCLLLCVSVSALAQSPAGKWISLLKFFDNDNYQRMELKVDGAKVSGKVGRNEVDGTFRNGQIQATSKPNKDTTVELRGTLTGDRISGTATVTQQDEHREMKWEARREADISAAPRTHTFEPTQFHHFFSDKIEPALHISPGDSVKTWSVDAGGVDPKKARRTSGGNPLTGPFYVEGTMPGDTLVVRLTRLRLNRDSAISGDMIVNGALNPGYVESRKRAENYNSDWKIDVNSGYAMMQKPTEKLQNYRVPLAPMLGCIGVAPGGGMQFRSGFLGGYGGNMDYNQVREGVTVYLPVNVPGALLFLGDGHALQGAGELTGDALETSMDIEFNVDIQRATSAPAPRFENADYLMASGIAGSIDEAVRGATTNLVRWLERKYGLNANEVSSVLGTAMVYDIAEVVDPSVHVVAKIPKSVLAPLKVVD